MDISFNILTILRLFLTYFELAIYDEYRVVYEERLETVAEYKQRIVETYWYAFRRSLEWDEEMGEYFHFVVRWDKDDDGQRTFVHKRVYIARRTVRDEKRVKNTIRPEQRAARRWMDAFWSDKQNATILFEAVHQLPEGKKLDAYKRLPYYGNVAWWRWEDRAGVIAHYQALHDELCRVVLPEGVGFRDRPFKGGAKKRTISQRMADVADGVPAVRNPYGEKTVGWNERYPSRDLAREGMKKKMKAERREARRRKALIEAAQKEFDAAEEEDFLELVNPPMFKTKF